MFNYTKLLVIIPLLVLIPILVNLIINKDLKLNKDEETNEKYKYFLKMLIGLTLITISVTSSIKSNNEIITFGLGLGGVGVLSDVNGDYWPKLKDSTKALFLIISIISLALIGKKIV